MITPEALANCVEAIRSGKLIERPGKTDKEFHFQDWFKFRLESLPYAFEEGGRNSYPDFRLVEHTEGYELKGLAHPGRDATFDSNSQVPTGYYNGRCLPRQHSIYRSAKAITPPRPSFT